MDGYDDGSGGDRRRPGKKTTIKVKSSQEGKAKGRAEMSAGTSRLYLSLRAFIPQHEQHCEIKDTEMLFNHYSIVLLAFAFTPRPVNLHGLLLCCQLISHPPASAEQPAVAGLQRERGRLWWLSGRGRG